METFLLKGKAVSDALRSSLEPRINALKENGIVPKLAAIIVGEDPASQVYVRNKARAFEKLNCKSQTFQLEADSDEQKVLELIKMHASSARKETNRVILSIAKPPESSSDRSKIATPLFPLLVIFPYIFPLSIFPLFLLFPLL